MKFEDFPFITVEQLADRLWVAEELGSNVYFLQGDHATLVLDTAYGLSDWKKLARKLCGNQPLLCVNSHEHPDHNAGNNQFEEVLVGRFGEPGSHKPMDADSKMRLYRFMGNRLEGLPFDYERWNPGPAEKIIPIMAGEKLELGSLTLEILETPGHTPGAIALWEKERRWLFTGDTLLAWEVWGQLAVSMALRCYLHSLEELAALQHEVDIVFPAHSLAGKQGETGRFRLPPEILSIYAEGTRSIVEGKIEGRDYGERNPAFSGMRYADFSIGGMAWDPRRV